MNTRARREALPSLSLLVLSPHLDDGVFACGRLLATASAAGGTPVVLTLFAGRPPRGTALTAWDRAAGFSRDDDVIGERREEDRRALAILGARPCWMDFLDHQYGIKPDPAEVLRRLSRMLARHPGAAVFAPLGLFHSDHRLASDAAMALLQHGSRRPWFIYADAIYRQIPGLVEARLATLRQVGLAPSSVRFTEDVGAVTSKRQAVACYRSQLGALTASGRPGVRDLAATETYWRIGP